MLTRKKCIFHPKKAPAAMLTRPERFFSTKFSLSWKAGNLVKFLYIEQTRNCLYIYGNFLFVSFYHLGYRIHHGKILKSCQIMPNSSPNHAKTIPKSTKNHTKITPKPSQKPSPNHQTIIKHDIKIIYCTNKFSYWMTRPTVLLKLINEAADHVFSRM